MLCVEGLVLTQIIFNVYFIYNFISRYWHRSLNPRKLVEVKFSHLSRNMTLQRTMKLYRLSDVSNVSAQKALTDTVGPKIAFCRSLTRQGIPGGVK